MYLFAGDQDPVGSYGKGVTRLHQIYLDLGISDVECRLYPGGRHEMLNEINRDEVTADLLDWLERHNINGRQRETAAIPLLVHAAVVSLVRYLSFDPSLRYSKATESSFHVYNRGS
ncbi:hypothetical protein D3C76_1574860 [compost metagenome]